MPGLGKHTHKHTQSEKAMLETEVCVCNIQSQAVHMEGKVWGSYGPARKTIKVFG